MFYQTYQTVKLRATVTDNMLPFRTICREIASSMIMDMFNFIHPSNPTIPQPLPAFQRGENAVSVYIQESILFC